ncbi:arylformamidase [Ammoniphilus sp. CFH 90114]|uniref:arylformamidase n=1 Tax=Ammoniphilus sp. CFH 90114 TaxID=2493665 RepID=UPI00100D9CC4|nr:arylformamidase [Ammoniphilus sp. CFH 90114]RXT13487.1 arylformamidase [Ammoniphilus sp. CFH 90114]
MNLLDISQRLHSDVPVWPGDTPFTFQLTWTKEQSGSVNVGQINMSTHTGTHIDAPFHFDSHGAKVIDLDLDLYVGPAKLIHISQKESIGAAELASFDLEGVKRLLIRTDSWEDPTRFPTEFTFLRPDIGPFLAEKGIRLIGLDVPSVDPMTSKELGAHHALLKNQIHILEGAVLRGIDEGNYELIALPLPLEEADGSPVRAVLRKI